MQISAVKATLKSADRVKTSPSRPVRPFRTWRNISGGQADRQIKDDEHDEPNTVIYNIQVRHPHFCC